MAVPAVLAGGAILLGLVGGGMLAWLRGRQTTAALLLWVPLGLLPLANLLVIIGVVVAERALYLPSAAVAFAVAAIIAALRPGRWARPATAAAVAVAVILAARAAVRMPDWHSTDSIMAAQLRDRPDSFRAN
jgi:hypothetical protein